MAWSVVTGPIEYLDAQGRTGWTYTLTNGATTVTTNVFVSGDAFTTILASRGWSILSTHLNDPVPPAVIAVDRNRSGHGTQ